MYKLTTNSLNQKVIILDNGNGSFTSFQEDESNTDYQAYLKWIEAGGVPLPADE